MSPATRRARLGVGHALAWVAFGLAAAALMTDAVARPGAPLALALGTACALAAAAVGIAVPARRAPRALLIAAAALAAAAAASAGALALLDLPPHAALAAALGLAAGLQLGGIRAQVAADPALAPRVRPAPTLLAAAIGVALLAASALLPELGAGIALIAAAVLQLPVCALAVGGTSTSATEPADGPHRASWTPNTGSTVGEEVREAPARAPAVPPQLLALLAIAAAGLTALAALRPALSAIGADDPQPAGPLALTLALGALLGPPLAMLAERLGSRAPAVLATAGGAAALIAPIARPGALDSVAAAVLGVALAASVALAELARRSGARPPTGAIALVLLAGAAGAGLAALLLAAVPLPDVVLGAALACLVAGIGVWVPATSSAPAAPPPS